MISTTTTTTRKRERIDDEDGPEVKKIRQGPSPVNDEELRGKLRYPHEGPSRWGGCDGQVKVIDLTTSDLETEEDDDFNNEDEEDSFIDDDDDDDDDDSSLNINDFYMEMKGDPTYSPKSRALYEWDPKYWHGY